MTEDRSKQFVKERQGVRLCEIGGLPGCPNQVGQVLLFIEIFVPFLLRTGHNLLLRLRRDLSTSFPASKMTRLYKDSRNFTCTYGITAKNCLRSFPQLSFQYLR